MKIGDKIKDLRIKSHISQKKLAENLKMPVSTLANYENNHREPNFDTLNKIANALKCSLSDLLEIDNKNSSNQYYSYYLEDYLKDTGYRIEYDEDNAAVFLVSDKEGYEITVDDIKDLKNSTKSFIEYKLYEIIKRSRKLNK